MSAAQTTSDAPARASQALTRQQLLLAGAGGAALLGAGGAIAPRLAQAAAGAKSGGTMRVGIGGGGPTDNFDAALINGPSATTRGQVYYETLVWLDGTFGLHNWLCDRCEPNAAADVWTVRLKQGLEFHNGKTVTADDVLFSIRRLLDPKTGATAAAQLGALDMKASKTLDERTVEFHLKRPTSFFDQILSDIVYIVPVGYNPKKPVSTGPWKLISYKPGQQTVLEPFANYWGVKPKLDRLVIVELPDDSARVNALLSGQVDAINQVPFAQVPVLQANGNLQTVVSPTAAWNPITMRVDTAPFNDVRVRQAIRLVMDREQAVKTALFGQGIPASDYYGRFDPAAGTGLKRTPDIERAKSLLKAAGKSGLKVELVTSPISAGIVEACQVLRPEREGRGHRHHAQEGRRLDVLRRLRQVAVRGRLLGRPPVPRDRVAERRAGRERRQHDALQRPGVQQALQPGRAPARRRQAAPDHQAHAEDPVRPRRQPDLVVPEHDRRLLEEGHRLHEGRPDGVGARPLPAEPALVRLASAGVMAEPRTNRRPGSAAAICRA